MYFVSVFCSVYLAFICVCFQLNASKNAYFGCVDFDYTSIISVFVRSTDPPRINTIGASAVAKKGVSAVNSKSL